ncbi:uroporphyrinogen-III synthase [Viridothelium virens]|uniref:Uroporphyrinogen-III synthase n=1 Tax=Viridothelium virens TaxID=1048519 RepID=A0A6A6GUD5_VIRVR|nr:uroporphyrinogen-III synthase [Viridothelium virens]
MVEGPRTLHEASTSLIPVLFLKTRSSPQDGYHDCFSHWDGGSYLPEFVPVLEHHLKRDSLSELLNLIESGAFSVDRRAESIETSTAHYGGLVFTSQRSVEAFTLVVGKLRQKSLSIDVLLPPELPLYVVGPATARGLKALDLHCSIVGEDSGNGQMLASFILQHYKQDAIRTANADKTKLPIMFLVGEQRRDVIPRTLQSGSLEPSERIGVQELVVYESGELSTFRSDFKKTWLQCQRFPQSWVVVFSPTGCKAMLEELSMLEEASGKIKENIVGIRRPLIATIGPTTRDFLVREFGLQPEVCAGKPSPEGLGEAVSEFMQSQSPQ